MKSLSSGAFKAYIDNELHQQFSERERGAIARILLSEIAGLSQGELFDRHLQIEGPELDSIHDAVARLKKGEPIQYVVGNEEFFGLKFKVGPQVLIPRPETEELVEFILKKFLSNSALTLLDIGTGSGAIALAIKAKRPEWKVYAVEIDESALSIASENARRHQLSIDFLQVDFLDQSRWQGLPVPDLLVSNPPYIPPAEKDQMSASTLRYEPDLALFSPESDPEIFYKALATYALTYMSKGSRIVVEMNSNRAKAITDCFQQGFETSVLKDLSGKERILFAIKN